MNHNRPYMSAVHDDQFTEPQKFSEKHIAHGGAHMNVEVCFVVFLVCHFPRNVEVDPM